MTRRSAQTSDLPIISDLLKSGQEILVQIAKEPIAKKGARITSHIALPGRFLVFMPTVSHIGVSRKIASEEERQRLKRVLVSERGNASGGFIVRTAAEGASEEDLRADLRFLLHLWDEIKQRSDSSKSPALIYHDLSLIERILRDQVSANFASIWVDSEADYERIVRFLNRFSPSLVRRVKLYTKEIPLFEHFGIQDEITKALAPRSGSRAAARSSSTRQRRWWPSTSIPGNMWANLRGLKTPSSRLTSMPCRRSCARFACATLAESSSSTSSTWTTARIATR
jgi:ribonuclease E